MGTEFGDVSLTGIEWFGLFLDKNSDFIWINFGYKQSSIGQNRDIPGSYR
ncbi:hypothetical protein J21TS7_13220 [Paenibacillus cineris]|uniref:Uncharacterized protein n=1 Tax=Paenibacillus cineris TaxID=237530 RepID=A0ABQ4L8U4_9BACL|nr:hypothetical protein J21TS7_13220 [Paenibacillus cineris]GIO61311.1 hypothetical protein J43TS9_28850 [Paenibacillus cineris]